MFSSFPTIFLTSSILLLIILTIISPVQCRNPKTAPAPSPASPNYSIFRIVCADLDDAFDSSVSLLESTPKVASARGLHNISIAILESAISNAVDTRAYIEAYNGTDAKLPGMRDALIECNLEYGLEVEKFGEALQFVKQYNYTDLPPIIMEASIDYIFKCDSALDGEQIVKDEVISRGNNVVKLFGLSVDMIVAQLNELCCANNYKDIIECFV